MKTILTIIITIILIDFSVFMMWAMSGQTPPDNFYIGAISHNLIKLVI